MNGARGFFPNTTGVMWRGWELFYNAKAKTYRWEAVHPISGEILYSASHCGIRAMIKHTNKRYYN